MSLRSLWGLSAALALGCDASTPPADASRPPPGDVAADLPVAPSITPAAPDADDERFQVTARRWLMAGDALTARDPFAVSVVAPAGVRLVDAWLDGAWVGALARSADGTFRATLPPASIGEHELRLAADRGPLAFTARTVHVTAALYAVVSVDWDSADPPQENLNRMEQLRRMHGRLRYTQFVGPYVFTDPSTLAARRQALVDWLRRQRTAGDELGVHIHPRCTFVDTTGVTCRSMPSYSYPEGDPTGYTVVLASYSAEEQATMLRAAADLMTRNGFERPTSFRAGGWTTQLNTLEACDRAGYLVESSAFPPETIQASWGTRELGRWNLMNWTGITPTSQPYHPSRTRLLADQPPPTFRVLEVPDNGTLVDYMLGSSMIRVLRQNWPEDVAVAQPTVFQVGLHPESFDFNYYGRLDTALREVDRHLHADDAGPVVYARLTELAPVWP
jgi:hypothetical protein